MTVPAQAQLCPNCGHKQDNPPQMNCEDCSWPLQAPAQAQHSPLPENTNGCIAIQVFSKIDGWQTLETFTSHNCAIARRHEIEREQPLYKGIIRVQLLPLHSPLPWKAEPETDYERAKISGRVDNVIAEIFGQSQEERSANTAFIVRACNEHETLLQVSSENDLEIAKLKAHAQRLADALTKTLSWLTSHPGGGAKKCYNEAREALALPSAEQARIAHETYEIRKTQWEDQRRNRGVM